MTAFKVIPRFVVDDKVISSDATIHAPARDHQSSWLQGGGFYEQDVLWYSLVASTREQRKKFVIDVGACFGNHSVFYSKFFKGIVAVEPNPEALFYLRHTVKDCIQKNIKQRWRRCCSKEL